MSRLIASYFLEIIEGTKTEMLRYFRCYLEE